MSDARRIRAVVLIGIAWVAVAAADEGHRLLVGRAGDNLAVARTLAEQCAKAIGPVSIIETPGGLADLTILALRQGDLALVPLDGIAAVSRDEVSRRLTGRLRLVAGPFGSQGLHLFVRRDRAPEGWHQLRGRALGVGPHGSGLATSARGLLDLHGLDPHADVVIVHGDSADALTALLAGELDGVFLAGGVAPPALAALTAQQAAMLAPLPPEPLACTLAVRGGVYQPSVVPRRSLPNQSQAILQMTTSLVLVAPADTPPRWCERLVRGLLAAPAQAPALLASRGVLGRAGMAWHAEAQAVFDEAASKATRPHSLLTAAPNGTYSLLGRGIQEAALGVAIRTATSAGSLSNLVAVATGSADLALVQGDLLSLFAQDPDLAPLIARVWVVAPLHLEECHLVVRRDLSVTTLRELAGRKVALGPAGSEASLTALQLLRRSHLELTHVEAHYLDYALAIERVAAGDLDAAFCVAGQPTRLLADLSPEVSARLSLVPIRLDAPEPYRQVVLTRVSYPWLADDVLTVSTPCLLVAGPTATDALVRAVVDGLYSPRGRACLVAAHPKAVEATRAYAVALLGEGAWRFHPAAATYLQEEQSIEEVDPLVARLADTDPRVRLQAVRQLARHGSAAQAALPALLVLLEQDDPVLRAEGLLALTAIGRPATVALRQRLRGLEPKGRTIAAWALARCDSGPERFAALAPLLADPEPTVRAAAAEALGHCEDVGAQAAKALVGALRDDEAAVRAAAHDSLLRLGSHARESLVEALGSPIADVRIHAVEVLSRLSGDASRVARSLRGLMKDPDARVREAIEQGLERLEPGESGRSRLLTSLTGRVDAARTAAAQALKALGFRATPEALLKSLQDPKASARRKAARALGRLGDPAHAEVLEKLAASDPDADVREAARQAAEALRKR